MVLWTIQDEAVWTQLQDAGKYNTPPEHIVFPPNEDSDINHAHYAYLWLAKKIAERVGPPPEGVEYPVWAWYKQQGQPDGKPDMRSSHYVSSKRCVRMKLDVPDWEVMLTDFDDWHFALNYAYLSIDEADSDAFDSWHESQGIAFRDLSDWKQQSPVLTEARSRIEQSWNRMIGVKNMDEKWHFPWEKRSIQATFWTLRREHVLSVEHFISR